MEFKVSDVEDDSQWSKAEAAKQLAQEGLAVKVKGFVKEAPKRRWKALEVQVRVRSAGNSENVEQMMT